MILSFFEIDLFYWRASGFGMHFTYVNISWVSLGPDKHRKRKEKVKKTLFHGEIICDITFSQTPPPRRVTSQVSPPRTVTSFIEAPEVVTWDQEVVKLSFFYKVRSIGNRYTWPGYIKLNYLKYIYCLSF